MKYLSLLILAISLVVVPGCATSTGGKLYQGEKAAIPTVNLAMASWTQYVNQGKATQGQNDKVIDDYNAYLKADVAAKAAFETWTQTKGAGITDAALTAAVTPFIAARATLLGDISIFMSKGL